MSLFNRREKPVIKTMGKTERFFKRLPFTTFFDPEFIGNKLDKKLIENVKNKDIEAIKSSILIGADVNAKDENGKTSLMIACEKSNYELAELFLKEYAKIDLKDNLGRTALHYACVQSNLRIVSLILNKEEGTRKYRKRINRKDKEGNTPLILATKYNHYYIVNYLLEKKANKLITNKEGKDAFFMAKNNENANLMVLLRKF